MKTLCLLLLFQTSLQLQCGKGKISAHVGGEFVIVCKYDTSRFLLSKKYWCRGSSRNTCEILLDSDDVAKGSYTHRSRIADAGRGGLSVKVTNLQIQDSGDYWIGIDKIYADIMVSISVQVTEVPVSKPRLWPLTSLVDRRTCWGESVTVRCGSTRGSTISYTWYQHARHKDLLLHRSSDLSLHCSTVTHSSEYYCSASNSASSEQSDVLSVQVLVPANSSCIYAVNIYGQHIYNCVDRMSTTTEETSPPTTGKETTEIHPDTRDQLLQTNQSHHSVVLSRAWTRVPFWYSLLRWGLFAAVLLTLCVVLRCITCKRYRKLIAGRRRM